MSDDQTNQPPRDTQLTEELAELESMLSAVALPPSRVQRDEMMFRAGQASAATTEYQRTFATAGKRQALVWSACSAVIAASLAVAVMTWLPQSADSPLPAVAESSGQGSLGIAAEKDEPPISTTPAQRIRRHIARRGSSGATAPLLVMRERFLRQQWDDPRIDDGTSIVALPAREGIPLRARTSREILQEFLPKEVSPTDHRSDPRQIDWPWVTKRSEETT